MLEINFLTLAEMVDLHLEQIHTFGGSEGVRDMTLLQSAIAQPQASFGGQWLHEDLFEMAAAYAFHVCQNHPFIDGNKRAALASALVFLKLNGITITDPKNQLYEAVMNVANGKLNKKSFAKLLKQLPLL